MAINADRASSSGRGHSISLQSRNTRSSHEAVKDVLYWVSNAPELGKQAVYLDDIDPTGNPPIAGLTFQELKDLRPRGVRIFAPPFPALLDIDVGILGIFSDWPATVTYYANCMGL